MEFDWDPRKAADNLKRHGVSFEDAEQVFDHPHVTRLDDREDYGEDREIALGRDGRRHRTRGCFH